MRVTTKLLCHEQVVKLLQMDRVAVYMCVIVGDAS